MSLRQLVKIKGPDETLRLMLRVVAQDPNSSQTLDHLFQECKRVKKMERKWLSRPLWREKLYCVAPSLLQSGGMMLPPSPQVRRGGLPAARSVLGGFLPFMSQAQEQGRGSRVPLLVTAIPMGQRMRMYFLWTTWDHKEKLLNKILPNLGVPWWFSG